MSDSGDQTTSTMLRSKRPRRGPRPKDAFDRTRPFTRAEAVEAGIEPRELRTQSFRRLMHNVYVDATVPLTPALLAQAPLALAHPVAWASHSSAGRIYGVPLPVLPGEHISVCKPGQRLNRAGVQSHVAPETSRVVVIGGVRVSAASQLFVELAELIGLVDLVVVGDNLVRRGIVSLSDLLAFCAESKLPGGAAARAAAAYVRERVDSAMETRLRMLLVLAGLPEPEVNITIGSTPGSPERRFDLSWPAIKVVVEYDGRHHIEREKQWEKDLDRREAIDDDEWRILVVTSKGIYTHPDRTLQRVHRLVRARRLPGAPVRLGDGWRAHFPVRESAD